MEHACTYAVDARRRDTGRDGDACLHRGGALELRPPDVLELAHAILSLIVPRLHARTHARTLPFSSGLPSWLSDHFVPLHPSFSAFPFLPFIRFSSLLFVFASYRTRFEPFAPVAEGVKISRPRSRHGLRDLLTPRHARAWRIRGDCRGGTVATVVEIRSDSFHRIRRFCTRSTFREPWKLSHFLIVITNTSRRYSGGMLQRVKRARLFHSIRVERRSGFFSFL